VSSSYVQGKCAKSQDFQDFPDGVKTLYKQTIFLILLIINTLFINAVTKAVATAVPDVDLRASEQSACFYASSVSLVPQTLC